MDMLDNVDEASVSNETRRESAFLEHHIQLDHGQREHHGEAKMESHEIHTRSVTKAQTLQKSWTIEQWSGVPRVAGHILYDREFTFANHRWRWRL